MLRRNRTLLFADGNLTATLEAHVRSAPEKVNSIPRDQFLVSSDEDIIEHILSQMLVVPLELHEDSATQEHEEILIDVSGDSMRNPFGDPGPINIPGVRVTVAVPYTGDSWLWKLRPSSGYSVHPTGRISEPRGQTAGQLSMVIEKPAKAPPEEVKNELDRNLGLVRDYIQNQIRDIERSNSQLDPNIRRAIADRRQRLENQEGIAQILNIPLKRRDGAPDIRPIAVQRALVTPLSPPPRSGFKPEPGITDEVFEDILSIIRHEGRTFESMPMTFAQHDEEDLRNILLAHLNGHFKGGATAETFRGLGKTDIRIEADDRAAFVAECKVWRGPKDLADAIDQLLGYLTWRDCKSAIVVFNIHNAKFSRILESLPSVFRQHAALHRDIGEVQQGEWRYILTSDVDENRRITVQAMIFDLYVKQDA